MLAERSDLLAEHSREPDDSHLDGEGTLSQDVVSEQVRLVYGQARVGLVVTLLLAGVALYATRALVPIAHAGAWCAAFAVLVGGRWWLLRAYARAGHRSTEALVWRQRWIVSMLLSGLVWGAGGWSSRKGARRRTRCLSPSSSVG